MNNLVGDVKANSRDFYRFILNSQKKYVLGIPPLKERQVSGLAQSDYEKASEFNCQFTDEFLPKLNTKASLMDKLERTYKKFIKHILSLPVTVAGPAVYIPSCTMPRRCYT